jgi:hypothetical protein
MGAYMPCTETRTQLASISAIIGNLERQLDEARRRMIAKELEVRRCESNTTATSQGTPQNGEGIFVWQDMLIWI